MLRDQKIKSTDYLQLVKEKVKIKKEIFLQKKILILMNLNGKIVLESDMELTGSILRSVRVSTKLTIHQLKFSFSASYFISPFFCLC